MPPHTILHSHITRMFSTLTLLGGLSDTGDSTPSSVDIGLFDSTLADEDPGVEGKKKRT